MGVGWGRGGKAWAQEPWPRSAAPWAKRTRDHGRWPPGAARQALTASRGCLTRAPVRCCGLLGNPATSGAAGAVGSSCLCGGSPSINPFLRSRLRLRCISPRPETWQTHTGRICRSSPLPEGSRRQSFRYATGIMNHTAWSCSLPLYPHQRGHGTHGMDLQSSCPLDSVVGALGRGCCPQDGRLPALLASQRADNKLDLRRIPARLVSGKRHGPETRDNCYITCRQIRHQRHLSRHASHVCSGFWLLLASRPQN